ncbi:hypothetical protein LT493_25945 [Streptomyces tricolor]|nr:hypothetical protein [Streptomyces tricolor]
MTCPVIRTDFTDTVGWLRLTEALEAPVAVKDAYDGPGSGPNPENADHADWFTSAADYVTPVDDVHYEGITAADVTALAPAAHDLGYGHLYLADAQTFASPALPSSESTSIPSKSALRPSGSPRTPSPPSKRTKSWATCSSPSTASTSGSRGAWSWHPGERLCGRPTETCSDPT